MKHLVTVKLETNHYNTNSVGWYAYFAKRPSLKDLRKVFDHPTKVENSAPLGWDQEYASFEEVPNTLSERLGAYRYFVAEAV